MRNEERPYRQLVHLVKRAQAGDAEAFQELYRRTAQAQYFNLSKRVGADAATDILQEVYLTAWKNIARIQPQVFVGYLGSVANNLARRYWERGCRPRETSAAAEDLPLSDPGRVFASKGDHTCDPAITVDARADGELLSQAMGEVLDDREREVILLRYYEEMRIDDVAEALGISPSTVKRTCRSALEKLRDRLGDLPRGAAFLVLVQQTVETLPAPGAQPHGRLRTGSWADWVVPAVAAVSVAAVVGCVGLAAALPRDGMPAEPAPQDTIQAEAVPAAPAPTDTAAPALTSMATERGDTVLTFSDETAVASVRLTDEAGCAHDPVEADTADPAHSVFRFRVPSGTYAVRAADAHGNTATGEITIELPPDEPVPIAR